MPGQEWTCPRCGLVGDHHKTPDPERCTHCCAADASFEILAALRTLLSNPSDDPDDAIWVDENYEPAEPIDPPAMRWFLTPADIAQAKARAAVARAEGRGS